MNPSVLAVGFGSFLLCLILHISVWRTRHPRRHALALFAIFFVPVGILLPVAGAVFGPGSWTDIAAILLLHTALSCAYIQIYPASQADSPSLRILVMVEHVKPRGMTETEIRSRFRSDELLEARLQDLVLAGLTHESNNRLALTPRGRAFIYPFVLFRDLLGAPPPKG